MPGNPDATPEPNQQPSWLHDVMSRIVDALEATPWKDPNLVANDVTQALWEAGALQAPEGFVEPTDEELEAQAKEALREWGQEWGDTSS